MDPISISATVAMETASIMDIVSSSQAARGRIMSCPPHYLGIVRQFRNRENWEITKL
ncbi:hypothetical protein KBA01_18700 [Kozakia baliensis]|nr:hypothetical protein KBA01_18700 [Kozakia baliensis]